MRRARGAPGRRRQRVVAGGRRFGRARAALRPRAAAARAPTRARGRTRRRRSCGAPLRSGARRVAVVAADPRAASRRAAPPVEASPRRVLGTRRAGRRPRRRPRASRPSPRGVAGATSPRRLPRGGARSHGHRTQALAAVERAAGARHVRLGGARAIAADRRRRRAAARRRRTTRARRQRAKRRAGLGGAGHRDAAACAPPPTVHARVDRTPQRRRARSTSRKFARHGRRRLHRRRRRRVARDARAIEAATTPRADRPPSSTSGVVRRRRAQRSSAGARSFDFKRAAVFVARLIACPRRSVRADARPSAMRRRRVATPHRARAPARRSSAPRSARERRSRRAPRLARVARAPLARGAGAAPIDFGTLPAPWSASRRARRLGGGARPSRCAALGAAAEFRASSSFRRVAIAMANAFAACALVAVRRSMLSSVRRRSSARRERRQPRRLRAAPRFASPRLARARRARGATFFRRSGSERAPRARCPLRTRDAARCRRRAQQPRGARRRCPRGARRLLGTELLALIDPRRSAGGLRALARRRGAPPHSRRRRRPRRRPARDVKRAPSAAALGCARAPPLERRPRAANLRHRRRAVRRGRARRNSWQPRRWLRPPSVQRRRRRASRRRRRAAHVACANARAARAAATPMWPSRGADERRARDVGWQSAATRSSSPLAGRRSRARRLALPQAARPKHRSISHARDPRSSRDGRRRPRARQRRHRKPSRRATPRRRPSRWHGSDHDIGPLGGRRREREASAEPLAPATVTADAAAVLPPAAPRASRAPRSRNFSAASRPSSEDSPTWRDSGVYGPTTWPPPRSSRARGGVDARSASGSAGGPPLPPPAAC